MNEIESFISVKYSIFQLKKISITCSVMSMEPLKSLNILKISDIFTLCQLKFYHKLINNKLFYTLFIGTECREHSSTKD